MTSFLSLQAENTRNLSFLTERKIRRIRHRGRRGIVAHVWIAAFPVHFEAERLETRPTLIQVKADWAHRCCMTEDDRIEALRTAANASGLTIDALDHLAMGFSKRAFRKFIGNASAIPSYMKSSDSPYVARKARAADRPI